MRYETSRDGRAVDADRAAVAPGTEAGEARGPTSRVQSPSADRDSLRAADRAAVATVAVGDGLRQRLDLLAALSKLDAARRVETIARRAAPRVELGRRDRLESRGPRQFDGGREKGGDVIGPNPTDKGRAGCKRHLVVDAQGIPFAALLTPANVHDSQVFDALLDAIPPLHGPGPGRPRQRPAKAHADKGYDSQKCRHACRERGIIDRIARRGVDSADKLGRYRWVVERDFAWLNAMRRLRTRYDRRAAHYLGFLYLGCALICLGYLIRL
jgi:transposase